MTIKTLITGIAFAVTASVSYAGFICEDCDQLPMVWGKVITLSAGPAWVSGGDNQSLFRTPLQYNQYRADKQTNTIGAGEIFFGLQRALNPYVIGQFGIGLAGAGNAKLQGSVWVDNDPSQNDYRYTYNLNHARVSLKGKLLGGDSHSMVNPYISGSIAAAFNHAYHFKAVPVSPLISPVRGFQSNTESFAFSYTLGAGISKAFDNHWRGEIGYEFADWGKSALGPVFQQPYHNGLQLSNVYSHQLLFGLSYLC